MVKDKEKTLLVLLVLFMFMMPTTIIASSSSSSSSSAASSDSQSEGINDCVVFGHWHILTKQNFSSQISLHTNILLLVSLPCKAILANSSVIDGSTHFTLLVFPPLFISYNAILFLFFSLLLFLLFFFFLSASDLFLFKFDYFLTGSGESRALMNQISRLVTTTDEDDKSEKFRSLKLMYMNRKSEKMLADAIGAVDDISILYYHHSSSYKYRGKLRAKSILNSVHFAMSVSSSPGEIPLVSALNTEDDLRSFLLSTDTAVLLLEFCGWIPQLLPIEKKNKNNATTEDGFGMQGMFSGVNFGEEAKRISTPGSTENQKGSENANLICGIKNWYGELPWLQEFSSINDTSSLHDADSLGTDNLKQSLGSFCTFEHFQQFNSFFSSFKAAAMEFFLPPERYRFGLVSDRSLLSMLGVTLSNPWSMVLYYEGCPNCLKILKKGDNLKNALQSDNSIITELEGDGQHLDPIIPKNKPSVLLFVDRFSDSSEIRSKSRAALGAFRQLGLHYQISNQKVQQNDDKSGRSSAQALQGHRAGHPRLKQTSTTQEIKLKEKMSIMIVNEGKLSTLEDVASNLQGSSLHEILAYILQQKKESKLGSIAKELGFQLLSDDSNIEVSDSLQSETKVEPEKVSLSYSEDNAVGTSIDLDTNFASDHDEGSDPTDMQSSSLDTREKANKADTLRPLLSAKPSQLLSDQVDISGDVKAEVKSCPEMDEMDEMGEECVHFHRLSGPFFFSDGNYQLLNALTGEKRIPSLVIFDPILQQHYAYHEETFNYTFLNDFFSAYVNGSLVPYRRSESKIGSHREGTHPPLINSDFHEADSIPRVTAQTFYKEVCGLNHFNDDCPDPAWDGDVLVLFSNKWCGFCQRMEMVVREVYRAVKGYMNMLKTGNRDGETGFSGDNLKNAILKLPKIFLMDCTLNDCSSMLKSVDQRELYPALLLFPAEKKTVVLYEGDISVANVIGFIANHGSYCQHLTSDKGILRNMARKRGQDHNLFRRASPTAIREVAAVTKDKSHEILLKDRVPKRAVEHSWSKFWTSKGLHGTPPSVVVGSILTATEKISMQPFDKSEVLIVKANQTAGIQGLIYNKPIRWDALHDLKESFELLKEAPLFFGGPLIKRGQPFVALSRRAAKDQHAEVLPGIYFLDQLATINEIEELRSGNRSLDDLWIFLGFSSWNWDQLFDEIAQGAWSLRENVDGIEWPLR